MIILGIMAMLLAIVLLLFNTAVDLRPADIRHGIAPGQFRKGKELLQEMQLAYGGKEEWLAKGTGTYEQIAEWYGNRLIAGWDTLPQRFQMTSILKTDNSELTLLNGLNQ